MKHSPILIDLGLTSAEHWKTVAKVTIFLVVAVPLFLVAGAGVVVATGGGVAP